MRRMLGRRLWLLVGKDLSGEDNINWATVTLKRGGAYSFRTFCTTVKYFSLKHLGGPNNAS
jgi:hypothetical protein